MTQPSETRSGDGLAAGPRAWLFLETDAVPESWRERGVPVVLVPLLPGETNAVLEGRVEAETDPRDEPLLRLVARGLSVDAIARSSGMSTRTVERRLAQLKDRFGVSSTVELGTLLSRRGF